MAHGLGSRVQHFPADQQSLGSKKGALNLLSPFCIPAVPSSPVLGEVLPFCTRP